MRYKGSAKTVEGKDDLTVDINMGNFQGKARLYAKYRPLYSKNYSTYLQEQLKMNTHSSVADIGAGTGIHTRVLANITDNIFAIEPDIDMLEECRIQLKCKNIKLIQGSAENTMLPDECVDYIVVAQAFHLFDRQKSLEEFRRVLRPHGTFILVWNSKEHENDLFYENEAVIKRYCPCYCREVHARTFFEESYQDCFSPETYTHIRFYRDSTELLNKNTYIMRTLSASYAITPDNTNYKSLIAALEIVFDRFSVNGVIEIPQSTVIYHGSIKLKGV